MAINAGAIKGNKEEKKFGAQPPMEAGTYPGRLVQVIDMGMQPQRPFKGQDRPPKHTIMLTYELSDCFMVDEEGKEIEDKPRWISETIPFYPLFADRAASTKRINAFDPDNQHDGDLSQMISAPVNVVIGTEKKGDKEYINVLGVTAMRAKDAAKLPELVNPPKVFDLDAPDMEVFNKLPKWLQDKIASNLNFKGSALERLLGEDSASNTESDMGDKTEAPNPRRNKIKEEVADEDKDQSPPWDEEDVPY